jgi:hypothetical protein
MAYVLSLLYPVFVRPCVRRLLRADPTHRRRSFCYVWSDGTVLALLVSAVFEGYDWRWATVSASAGGRRSVLALQPASQHARKIRA